MNVKILSKVHKTVIEMLVSRNYKIKYDKLTDVELLNKYNENNFKLECFNEDKSKKMLSIIYEHNSINKIGLECIKILIEKYIGEKNLNNYTNFILILSENLTPKAIKEIADIENIDIEVFLVNEMIFNITKHKLQPRFTLLNSVENKKIIEKFQKKIPYIKSSDKISRFYGAKVGDIFKINRNDDSIYYRIVI